jgi:hypothetical protein
MNTFITLDNEIHNRMAVLDDNDVEKRIELMALIDKRYHYNDTVSQYNQRLRKSVASNFNKGGFLTNDKKNLFRMWENQLNTLPDNASREDIFRLAPEEALYIVGL